MSRCSLAVNWMITKEINDEKSNNVTNSTNNEQIQASSLASSNDEQMNKTSDDNAKSFIHNFQSRMDLMKKETKLEAKLNDGSNNDINYDSPDNNSGDEHDINYDTECDTSEEEEEDDHDHETSNSTHQTTFNPDSSTNYADPSNDIYYD
ncbi:hypothetical protein K501DRAFT_272752 [Backusella circina FSU 941]|nr:hypothetical protein K501DRAFT_280520 [Backusella circina FSU 941]KAI8883349.1 hypothetical protein K501DRAFT_272752 [Backusella circina FSU 941]